MGEGKGRCGGRDGARRGEGTATWKGMSVTRLTIHQCGRSGFTVCVLQGTTDGMKSSK